MKAHNIFLVMIVIICSMALGALLMIGAEHGFDAIICTSIALALWIIIGATTAIVQFVNEYQDDEV